MLDAQSWQNSLIVLKYFASNSSDGGSGKEVADLISVKCSSHFWNQKQILQTKQKKVLKIMIVTRKRWTKKKKIHKICILKSLFMLNLFPGLWEFRQ